MKKTTAHIEQNVFKSYFRKPLNQSKWEPSQYGGFLVFLQPHKRT